MGDLRGGSFSQEEMERIDRAVAAILAVLQNEFKADTLELRAMVFEVVLSVIRVLAPDVSTARALIRDFSAQLEARIGGAYMEGGDRSQH
jgi:hypothetical protein